MPMGWCQSTRYAASNTVYNALLLKIAAQHCACERVLLDTAYKHVVFIVQSVTLEYQMDQTVATADTPPVVLGRMPVQFVESMGAALRCTIAYCLTYLYEQMC